MPTAKKTSFSTHASVATLAFVAVSVVTVSLLQTLQLAGDLGGDSSSSTDWYSSGDDYSSSDYSYSSSDYSYFSSDYSYSSSDYGYSSSDYGYASSDWYSYSSSSESSYASSEWGWYSSSSEYSSDSWSSSEESSSDSSASSEQMSSSESSSEDLATINEDDLVMSDAETCSQIPYDNELVSVVTDEFGNEFQLTKDDLYSWSEDPYHDAGGSSSQISGGASSEFVGIAICANVDRTVKVSAFGRTTSRKYTRTIILAPSTQPPTRPGEKPRPAEPVKRTIVDNVALRCSRLEAEASAEREAKDAFINSCGNPPPCVSDTLCRDRGVVHDLSPKPLVYDTKVTEHRAVTAMGCANNKAYAASAAVKGECTSTRICENKDFSRR